jgi:lysophospholipase L1-like esterase
MKIRKKIFAVSFLLMAFTLPPKNIRIYMIGDSTMCLYGKDQRPVTGWGMPFADYFDNTVTIKNEAKGGRSTRTFVGENRWAPIVDSLQAGDYVMIQFGHNDESNAPQYAERYTPVEDYKKYLIKFITESREKNAIPVLITPVTRRNFDTDGKIKETHIEYSKAVREIGESYKVPVIDLDERSRELVGKLGPETSKMIYMGLDTLEHPNYPVGRKDNTHFNEYGARLMAELVLNEIKRLNLELADRIVKVKPTAAK